MSIVELLDRIGEAGQGREQVSLRAVLEVVGNRSFGSLLFVAGAIVLAPLIGDIPGVPTLMGVFVMLVSGQILAGRRYFWLPAFMLEQSVDTGKLERALAMLRKPAGWIDRLLSTRLTLFTDGWSRHLIACASIAVAAMMPFMEVVPFSANLAGIALLGFGLALIAGDGLVALVALLFTVATAWVGFSALL
jgi:hypothetical protein